ncbi:DUF4180 domain-containing protein [Fibrella sp. HMF5335]|uniref:DUF4180 domain-containing protein n=1 Tax=Fibrella rubiginis TaxID=2817060 RepID=A0A939GLW8_9BACT|nr:DUF4180 domain-containing protein [Fibrella rubiginis]MBO0939830.1 DUF4180 domain-containing protein [Fibrella rubiginis]
MTIQHHQVEEQKIAEIISTEVIIQTVEDGANLVANIYYQGYDALILHQGNLTANFFDLTTQLVGEILQKFSNFRVRLAIVGDFSSYSSKSLQAFIAESNKGGQINFVSSIAEALIKLSKA